MIGSGVISSKSLTLFVLHVLVKLSDAAFLGGPSISSSRPYIPSSFLSASTVSSAAASFASAGGGGADHSSTQQRTLYDVLGASGQESRSELKKLYVQLAKQYHPDAVHSGGGGSDAVAGDAGDFSEIAAAWSILSDRKERKRYDRTLVAEKFSEDLVHWADEIGKQAGPVLEKVAIPFLRRTTATTLASIQAAANDLQKKRDEAEDASSPADATRTFQAAVEAAQRAGRYVDSLEMKEKSIELEKQAAQEATQLEQMEEKMHSVINQRMTVNLHTPKVGLASAEAFLILQDFNTTVRDSVSLFDRALLKHTIEEDILELRKCEVAFAETESVNEEIQSQYEMTKQRKLEIHNELKQSILAEESAIRALERAQKRVVQTKINLSDVIHDIEKTRIQANKSTHVVKRAQTALEKSSEKVRKALRQKERDVLKHKGLSDKDTIPDAMTADQREERLQHLEQLRMEEQRLAEAKSNLKVKAAELLAQASELKKQAEELED